MPAVGNIPVVWLHDPDDTRHYWERDWLRFLLSDLQVTHLHAVDTSSAPLDDALVIFGNDVEQPAVRAYIDSYARTKTRHGLIHLSDEYGRHDIACYAAAAVRFRNQLRLDAPQNTFGLGYKQGFWEGYVGRPAREVTTADRPHVWSFAGDVRKADRPEMLRKFRGITPNVVHQTSYWNSPDCLPTSAYRDLLLKTVFVPSPQGTLSLECFRTYEALEAGCIPVVIRESKAQPFNYYAVLFSTMGFTEPVPFPQVRDWSEGASFVKNALKEPERIEALRIACYDWWSRYKHDTRARFTEQVRHAFGR